MQIWFQLFFPLFCFPPDFGIWLVSCFFCYTLVYGARNCENAIKSSQVKHLCWIKTLLYQNNICWEISVPVLPSDCALIQHLKNILTMLVSKNGMSVAADFDQGQHISKTLECITLNFVKTCMVLRGIIPLIHDF